MLFRSEIKELKEQVNKLKENRVIQELKEQVKYINQARAKDKKVVQAQTNKIIQENLELTRKERLENDYKIELKKLYEQKNAKKRAKEKDKVISYLQEFRIFGELEGIKDYVKKDLKPDNLLTEAAVDEDLSFLNKKINKIRTPGGSSEIN